MYIKNYHNNEISPLISSQNQIQIELIKIQKNDYNTKMWVKINNQIFKIIILDEKYRTKFFVFDSFNNYNVFEIFSDFEEDSKTNDKQRTNIVEFQGYFYLTAPLSGKIEKINVKEVYEEGDLILVISAMKMEHSIFSDSKYKLVEVLVQSGNFVDINQKIIKLEKI